MPNPRVFFDFTLDNAPLGRVVFELFASTAPKTCENFRALATGEKGLSRLSQVPLFYKGSVVHRSIPGFMIQGGDFTHRNGKGGESIYGSPFPDEDLSHPLDAEALLAMANKGPDTNGSQWFITLAPCPHLNGKHVVFGKVIRGYQDVVQKIASVPTDAKDRPSLPVVISHSGELVLRKPPGNEKPRREVKESHPRSASVSSSSSVSTKGRRRQRSRDLSKSRSESPENSRPHKKKKASKHSSKKRHVRPEDGSPHDNRKETEEEYDARLEREEKERIAEQKKLELSKVRERLQRQQTSSAERGGIRYKGRGRMHYTDPETFNSETTDRLPRY